MPQREEEEEKTQKAKEEKHPSLDHEAQKHHNKNVTVILDLEESTSTTSSKTSSSSPSNSESPFPFTPQDQKRIIRQIDLRVVLLLGAMYAVSLIDRSQIGLAMISGMGTDLQLTVGARYNIINAVFFGPYVLFQLPSTVLLRKIGPKRFLSGATLAWGLATLACGFVREWRDLVALRVVLGACEAGFYPGGFFYFFLFALLFIFSWLHRMYTYIQREGKRGKRKERKREKKLLRLVFCFTLLTHITYHFLFQSSTELTTTSPLPFSPSKQPASTSSPPGTRATNSKNASQACSSSASSPPHFPVFSPLESRTSKVVALQEVDLLGGEEACKENILSIPMHLLLLRMDRVWRVGDGFLFYMELRRV